ncbi:phospholipase D family protein [Mesorhizobium loti]|uniref:phospholipase D family protein n=1 Tax=Rhizobium loti TaxID=381 RepID=UPI0004128BBD|nr:phospholipase D family protein [Mesorhizobium loti]
MRQNSTEKKGPSADTVLAPDNRLLFGTALHPPKNHRLHSAIGTTYSLDFIAALTVPVALTLGSALDRAEVAQNALATLAAMQRLSDRVMICVEAGNIHARPGRQHRLVTLLEGLLHEIVPPPGASFHPKLWALRFEPDDGKGPAKLRLLVMSRNLTQDRSWDMVLQLDGEEKNGENASLSAFIDYLLDQTGRVDTPRFKALRKGLHRAQWELPPGFDSFDFAAHLPGRKSLWQPEQRGRLAVISPFCDDGGLKTLGKARIEALVARDDWLARLPEGGRTASSFVLSDVADMETEEGMGFAPASEAGPGLHAKVYIVERGPRTWITLGSGNATTAGLGTGAVRNIEVFATLSGLTRRVGAIGLRDKGLLGQGGLGPLLKEWQPRTRTPEEIVAQEFERKVWSIRQAICATRPRLEFTPNDGMLEVQLDVELPARMGFSFGARLITQERVVMLDTRRPWGLGQVPPGDATSFLCVELADSNGQTAAFVTQADTEGLPNTEERLEAILAQVVETPAQFMRFVTAMLEREPDLDGLVRLEEGWRGDASGPGRTEEPVLEALLAAFLAPDGSERLASLDRMVRAMKSRWQGDRGADSLWREFDELWSVFREASK